MNPSENTVYRVNFDRTGHSVMVSSGTTVMSAAQQAGVLLNNGCGGNGTCGKCAVTIISGTVTQQSHTPVDSENGTVLACSTEIQSDLNVRIPDDSLPEGKPAFDSESSLGLDSCVGEIGTYALDPLCRKIHLDLPAPSISDCLSDFDRITRGLDTLVNRPIQNGDLTLFRSLPGILRSADFNVTATIARNNDALNVIRIEAGTSMLNYGIAVDIGTTTLMARLIDLDSGTICASTAAYNSQMRYGDDVINRIVHSQEHIDGLSELTDAVVSDINQLVDTVLDHNGIDRNDITSMVCTGNTVMIHIILGLPLENIRREPYIPALSAPPLVHASDIGINIGHAGRVGFLQGAGAYVGSDITAAVLASGMADREEIGLLIDVGTNGEIVLGNRDWLICCSASAGPSFEGAGTRCGMRASDGAIEKVRLNGTDLVLDIIGGDSQQPRGICGSGYIDLLAELFSQGLLDRTGRFRNNEQSFRLRNGEDEMEFLLSERADGTHRGDIVITESDIASLIRTKGAIYSAAETLLSHMGLDWDAVNRIHVSGGFGNYLDVSRSITVGLLPDVAMEQFHFIGNGSIAGAQVCLLSADAQKAAEDIAGRMTYHDLSTDPGFMDRFSSSLFLPHTNLDKFPSVVSIQEQRG
jgi:uncharacterized 2Fe-2S/4Fe-4S cluster protein (DUF4445 family)